MRQGYMRKIKIILFGLLFISLSVPFPASAEGCQFTADLGQDALSITITTKGGYSYFSVIITQNGENKGSYALTNPQEGVGTIILLSPPYFNIDKTKDFTVSVVARPGGESCSTPNGGTEITFSALEPAPTVTSSGSTPAPVHTSVTTGLGTFSTDPAGFVGNILTLAVGVAGGIAFLLIVFGAIRILTSAGDPEAVNQGKEILTSAIIGLLFIIFSTFILKLIGVTVFQGFNIFQ